jgi:hypothetical protein
VTTKLLVAFRVVYFLATALFFTAAGLVTASHLIADRGPQSPTYLAISVTVSGVFLAAGLLLLGIQSRTAGIAKRDTARVDADGNGIARHLPVLLVYLMVGGLALCAIMAIATFAILARINQGFAVFG